MATGGRRRSAAYAAADYAAAAENPTLYMLRLGVVKQRGRDPAQRQIWYNRPWNGPGMSANCPALSDSVSPEPIDKFRVLIVPNGKALSWPPSAAARRMRIFPAGPL